MNTNPYPGKLVVFEGSDGVGKSTQAKFVREHMAAQKWKVVLTKEPYTKTPDGHPVHLGNEIYQVLRGEHSRTSMANLMPEQFQRYFYFPNRVQHYLDIVVPSLRDGMTVLSDRGVASVCYGARNVGMLYSLMAEQLAMFEALQLPWPDAIIIYDVPVEVAMERMRASGKKLDAHEQVDTLERVRSNYQLFAKSWPNCRIVDATAVAEYVFLNQTLPILDAI